jgi:hypothetical protein
MAPVRSPPALLCYLFTLILAVLGSRPSGDGGEYLLTAHALARHASPDIRVADAAWLGARVPRWRHVSQKIERGIRGGDETPLPSVRRAPGGEYYSLHFWFYSLLAIPLLGLVEILHLSPVLALACVNGLGVSLGIAFLFRCVEDRATALVASGLYLLCGTTFYLGWTGPEAVTGAAVLIACLTAPRGELGIAGTAAGVAAVQNPSAVFLFPFVVWSAWPKRSIFSRRDLVLTSAGVLLAAIPYLFFYYKFRIFSLIAHFATDLTLIGPERAWSLVFDLNEGLVVGLPGLLAGFLAFVIIRGTTTPGAERGALEANVIGTTALVTCMAIPTFSIHNWNSGNSVFIRYGYWLAMPLFALALALAQGVRLRLRMIVAAAVALLQLGVLALNGPFGGRYSYTRHTLIARFALRHLPGLYNPVPEIFYERSLGWEVPTEKANIVIWPEHGAPEKIMLREGYAPVSERVCPDGGEILSDAVHVTSAGYTYLDAPFRCRAR